MKHATLKEVAKIAGVSLATASRALNNRGDVDQDTRKRVLEVANRLTYTPNPLARGLLSGTTKTIGVLVTSIQNPFYAAVVAGIEAALAKEGYTIILCSSHEDPEAERVAIELLIRRRVDGLIIAPVQSQFESFTLLQEHNIPFVFIGRYAPGIDTDYVVCDDHEVGRIATEHLIIKGYRQIVFLNSFPNSSSELRQRGYEVSLKKHGIPVVPDLIRIVGGEKKAQEVIMAMLKKGLRPNAIFCFCDDMAVEVLQALNNLGIKVPEDMALVGCDNMQFTGLLHPSLTTIDIPKFEMGAQAVKILLTKIKYGKKKTTQVVLEPKLIERASTYYRVQ